MLSFASRCRRGSSHITGAMRDRKYRGAGEGEGRVASHWVRVVGIGSSARVRAQSRSRIVREWPRIVIREPCARSQSAIYGALARRREQRHHSMLGASASDPCARLKARLSRFVKVRDAAQRVSGAALSGASGNTRAITRNRSARALGIPDSRRDCGFVG